MRFKRSLAFLLGIQIVYAFYLLPAVKALTLEESVERKKLQQIEMAEKARGTTPAKKTGKTEPAKGDKVYVRVAERRDFSPRPQKKDPRLACLLSLMIPGGGGQIYLRKDLKGIGFCLATSAGYGLTGYYLYNYFLGSATDTDIKSKFIISGLLLTISIVIHVVGIIEAYSDAEEMNKENYYYGSQVLRNPYGAEIRTQPGG
ncbi:MAG: hypothetical protein GY754_32295 [bacterium]|nr:hypothetical protein [bacterium]